MIGDGIRAHFLLLPEWCTFVFTHFLNKDRSKLVLSEEKKNRLGILFQNKTRHLGIDINSIEQSQSTPITCCQKINPLSYGQFIWHLTTLGLERLFSRIFLFMSVKEKLVKYYLSLWSCARAFWLNRK